MKRLFIFFFTAGILLPSAAPAQVPVAAKPVVYQLPSATYDSVKRILKNSWAPALKDTIIIHYQPEIPEAVARENDEIIQQKVTEELRFLHNKMVERKNITVMQFAADGPNNKYMQEFDNLVVIDKDHSLHNLLFRENTAVSVMLLPSGKCIYFTGSEKWAALTVTSQMLQQALGNELAKK